MYNWWQGQTQTALGTQRRKRWGTRVGPEVGLGQEGRPLVVRTKGLIRHLESSLDGPHLV